MSASRTLQVKWIALLNAAEKDYSRNKAYVRKCIFQYSTHDFYHVIKSISTPFSFIFKNSMPLSAFFLKVLSLRTKSSYRASLVAQWLGICLPMQGTRVRALVWEDPTCRRATKPVSHSYWACASGACAPQQERPRWWEARSPQLEKGRAQQRRPNKAKKKLIN